MNFRKRLAAHLRTLARWLDPPPPDRGDADLAAADRYREICAHVDAGRIRRRRGESQRAFSRRLARGDFVVIDNLIDFSTERARRAETCRKVAARW